MTWVAFDDVSGERVVVELQGTVVEVFRSRTADTVRMHLSMLRIGVNGPDEQGAYGVDLVAPDGRVVTTVRVAEPSWSRLWPWVERVRQAQLPLTPYA